MKKKTGKRGQLEKTERRNKEETSSIYTFKMGCKKK